MSSRINIFWLSPAHLQLAGKKKTNYEQSILERSAVSLPCSSLFPHHVIEIPTRKTPQKPPTQNRKTNQQKKKNPKSNQPKKPPTQPK